MRIEGWYQMSGQSFLNPPRPHHFLRVHAGILNGRQMSVQRQAKDGQSFHFPNLLSHLPPPAHLSFIMPSWRLSQHSIHDPNEQVRQDCCRSPPDLQPENAHDLGVFTCTWEDGEEPREASREVEVVVYRQVVCLGGRCARPMRCTSFTASFLCRIGSQD